jgi:hypothetical protein
VAVVGAVEVDADGDDLPPSDPDEQPERTAVAAVTTKIGKLRMPPIYATLASVIERTTCQECCWA